MKKWKWIAPLFLAIVIAAVWSIPEPGQAATELEKIEWQLKELKRQKAEAQRKVKEAEREIIRIHQEKEKTAEEIAQLYEQIEELTGQLQTLEKDIALREEELNEAKRQLDEAVLRIAERDKLLKERLRLMYINGTVSYLEVLMNATSFNDFINRYEYLTSLVSQDKDLLLANQQDKAAIEGHKQEIETLLAQLTKDYEQSVALRSSLLVKQRSKEVAIASLNEKEQHLEHITEENEQALLKAAADEDKLLAKREYILSSGKLKYPLPQVYRLSSGYGQRIDPITGRRGAFHQGLDFAAPTGTRILAAETGTVIVAEWYGGYGNCVIISHGGGVWTLYAHMSSISVKKGQTVKRGNTIGKVGSTGRSTGAHLHFEVRVDQKHVDPKKYLNI